MESSSCLSLVILGFLRSTVLFQQFKHFFMTFALGVGKWRTAPTIFGIDINTFFDKEFNSLKVAFRSRQVNAGALIVFALIEVYAGSIETLQFIKIADAGSRTDYRNVRERNATLDYLRNAKERFAAMASGEASRTPLRGE